SISRITSVIVAKSQSTPPPPVNHRRARQRSRAQKPQAKSLPRYVSLLSPFFYRALLLYDMRVSLLLCGTSYAWQLREGAAGALGCDQAEEHTREQRLNRHMLFYSTRVTTKLR
ncbi:unnamed protein product, partial [Ectocarpus sp. 8 AP-2014]